MAVTNNNLRGVDRPIWEQLTTPPAASGAGMCIADDGVRYIYVLLSATAWWRYDTWSDSWQQLASLPGGTVGIGTCIRYVTEMGGQFNGVVYGSVYAVIANTTAPVFYRYDIATNTWSSALSVTNAPATLGTDASINLPEPSLNGFVGGYHGSTSLMTVTASATAAAGATTISVNALGLALPIGAVLNFGTYAAPIWAVLTSAAAAAATSITVSPLIAQVTSAATALWYADMYLIGNGATQMYRYNIAGNAWSTTSSNSGTPALPAITGAPGAGCRLVWLPGSGEANALNSLICVRGGATANIYMYRLDTNAWSTLTYNPATETFTTGTCFAARADATGKQKSLIIEKDATNRIYELLPAKGRLECIANQNLTSNSTALVGDRLSIVRTPDGIDFLYFWMSTSSYFLRTGLFF